MGMSQFQVELLKKLPREPEAPITLQELALRLARNWDQTRSETGASAEISDASKRKRVANNLETVLELHPNSLERTTHPKNKRQYLYRLKASAPMMLMSMSQEQMMAFGLLSKFGTDLLTQSAHRALTPFFDAAKEAAAEAVTQANPRTLFSSDELGRKWLKKIEVFPAVMPFCPPEIDESIKQTIHHALLHEEMLHLKVRDAVTQAEEECFVSPLGLVQQGVRTYLIGTKRGQKKAERFLLARITWAKAVLGHLEIPENWDLKEALKPGISHPVFDAHIYGTVMDIELLVDKRTQWLKETPLGKGQQHKDLGNGDYILNVKLPMTEELVRWLLSMSYHVKVQKPDFLAQRLRDDLQKSVDMYR
jgi:predicted DNA-binding transcriptional regulator YafY